MKQGKGVFSRLLFGLAGCVLGCFILRSAAAGETADPPSKMFVKNPEVSTQVVDSVDEKLSKPSNEMIAFAKKYSAKNQGLNSQAYLLRERAAAEITKLLQESKKLENPPGDAYYTVLANVTYALQQSEELQSTDALTRILAEYREDSLEKMIEAHACRLMEAWKSDSNIQVTMGRARRLLDGIVESVRFQEVWQTPHESRKDKLENAVPWFLAGLGFKDFKKTTLSNPFLIRGFSVHEEFVSYEVRFPASEQTTKVHFHLASMQVIVESLRSDVQVGGFNGRLGRYKFEQMPDFVIPIEGGTGIFYGRGPGPTLAPEMYFKSKISESVYGFSFGDAVTGYLYETLPRSILKLKAGPETDAEAWQLIKNALFDSPCLKSLSNSFLYRAGEWKDRRGDGH